MTSPSLTTRLRRFLRPQPRASDTFYKDILYLFARTRSLEDLTLQPGDTLIAYTDGLTEAENQAADEWGDSGLLRVLSNSSPCAESIAQAILNALDAHVADAPQRDDITLLILRNHAARAPIPRSSPEIP